RHRSFFAAQRARLLRAGRALPRPSREGSMSLTRVGETSGGSRSGSRNSTPCLGGAQKEGEDEGGEEGHWTGEGLECPRWKTKT
ncbi:unnamed protein product, partial [Prorocentrum cordatum]